jgi:hypothetical protein
MRKLLVVILAIPALLSGCSHSAEQIRSHPPTGMVTQHVSKNWVVYKSTTTYTEYYVLTNEKITKVGKVVFDFHGSDVTSQGPSGWGTNDADAMKVYEIPEVDTNEAVAVEMKDGLYVRANEVGNKKP